MEFRLIDGNKVLLVDHDIKRNNITISDKAYTNIVTENNPACYVTKLSYAIVGFDYLRTCYIEDSENNLYPNEYPGRVKILIYKFFKKFLFEKGYRDGTLAFQLGKLNVYLGRSCTYARKKYKRQMEKKRRRMITYLCLVHC